MTEQTWKSDFPPARPRNASIVIAFGLFAVIAIAVVNLYEGMRPAHHVPSALLAQQLRPVVQAPPDPDAFNEDRDGNNALSLEDTNGKASIWQDTTSGARIFCLDSCMLLPHPHHHHKNK